MTPSDESNRRGTTAAPIAPPEGRRLFGLDPAAYQRGRPPYPEWVFEALVESRALGPGTATVEIGAGTGLATRRLLQLGADPFTVIEPDPRFHPLLQKLLTTGSAQTRLLPQTFEDAALDSKAYDLIAAATTFHWIDEATGLSRCANLLRPAGQLALWWNVFGDPDRADAFHEATRAILAPLAVSPSGGAEEIPFALRRAERRAALVRAGFVDVEDRDSRWTIALDTAQLRDLYLTFSSIQRLPPERRVRILDALMSVSEREFGGRVERNLTTVLYTARARG